MDTNLRKQLKYHLVDLQLADDPKQYLIGRVLARLEELETLLDKLESFMGTKAGGY